MCINHSELSGLEAWCSLQGYWSLVERVSHPDKTYLILHCECTFSSVIIPPSLHSSKFFWQVSEVRKLFCLCSVFTYLLCVDNDVHVNSCAFDCGSQSFVLQILLSWCKFAAFAVDYVPMSYYAFYFELHIYYLLCRCCCSTTEVYTALIHAYITYTAKMY